jgi:hypothetical protein
LIGRNFIAIVLAMGLILSIGIALGQEDKDKLIQEMKEKELASNELEGKEPIWGQPTEPTEIGTPPSSETTPSTQNQLAVETPTLIRRTFNRYVIQQKSSRMEDDANSGYTVAEIDCIQDTETVGILMFVKDSANVNPSYLYFTDHIAITYHYSRYNDILALLEGDGVKTLYYRNPIDAYLAADRNM